MRCNSMSKIIVTGSAGFIGFHLCKKLLEQGYEVIGIDNLSNYYDTSLKERRNEILFKNSNFSFYKVNIADYKSIEQIVEVDRPEAIIHLAAQAGVRYSTENPWTYSESNYIGTLNIFEVAKRSKIKKVLYASTSSIYGDSVDYPYKESQRTDNPISLYAATKKANEVLAYSYSNLYDMDMIGLRFFTVYGEFNRPDMALFKFAKNILLDKPIDVYNNGEMYRAFTYVGDVIDGITRAMKLNDCGHRIYNIGGEKAIKLTRYIELIEENLGKKAIINYLPMHKADCVKTEADVSQAKEDFGYNPKVSIEEGVKIFCDWFLANRTWVLDLKEPRQQN